MRFAWFAFLHNPNDADLVPAEAEVQYVRELVRETPRLRRGLIYTPWDVTDLFFDDGVAPQIALQLYFDDISALEAALAPGGHLQGLTSQTNLPLLRRTRQVQQAMVVRQFPVPDPEFRTAPDAPYCTYLVHYPGAAADLNAWLAYYLEHHTRIMATFPGIREVEVCSRLDYCSFVPWPRADHMQRNKVVFDDSDALKASMQSAVMQKMRADFHSFPPFTGGNVHYPMQTCAVPAVSQAV